MNEETNELLQHLMEIAERSNSREISWVQSNPSTFYWHRESMTSMIQKAITPRIKIGTKVERHDEVDYLFQVMERSNRSNVLSLSSKERPEFANVLAEIYRAAERSIDINAGDVLRRLLEK